MSAANIGRWLHRFPNIVYVGSNPYIQPLVLNIQWIHGLGIEGCMALGIQVYSTIIGSQQFEGDKEPAGHSVF